MYFVQNFILYKFGNIFPKYNYTLGISDGDLSQLSSILGYVALPGYFLGGFLTEKFKPRNLLVIAIGLICLTGIWFETVMLNINAPGDRSAKMIQYSIIYAIWGFCEGFLFYAAYVKVIASLQTKENQVKVFSISRAFNTILGIILTLGIGFALKQAGIIVSINGQNVEIAIPVLMFVIFIISTLCCIYIIMKIKLPDHIEEDNKKLSKKKIMEVIKNPRVWMMSLTILGFGILSQSSQIFGNILQKNLGLSDAAILPFTTFAQFGCSIVILPFMLFINKRVKSYSRLVVIVGITYILWAGLTTLLPIFRGTMNWTVLIVFMLLLFVILSLNKSIFWNVRWAQVQELRINQNQYGFVIGIFATIGFSSEGWFGSVTQFIQNKYSEKVYDSVTKKTISIASLKGNQIILLISFGIAIFCFLFGLLAHLLNRKDYIMRGRDTYIIIKDNEEVSSNKEKTNDVEIRNNKNTESKKNKIIWRKHGRLSKKNTN